KININKVSTFAPVTNTIYFKVDPEPELDALHKKIQESISSSDNKDEFSFVPHITISQDLVDEEYHDVFGSLKMKKVELERSEEHTSELQSRFDLVCRLLLEK